MIEAMNLVEAKEAFGKLSATRAKIDALVGKKNADGKLDWAAEDMEQFQALQKQAADEHAEYKKWEAVAQAAAMNKAEIDAASRAAGPAPFGAGTKKAEERADPDAGKSLGRRFIESKAYQIARDSSWNIDAKAEFALPVGMIDCKGMGDAEYKTTMSTSAGFAPFVTRSSDVVPYAFRRVLVPALMPSITTTENSIQYMEETTRTVAASTKAEGSALAEGAIAYTQRTVNIEDIGEHVPVTERQLADAPQVAGLIDNSLMSAIDRTEETQILSGTGTSPQLVGFLGAGASSVQTQALGSDPVITGFMKAMTKVMHTGFAEPSAAVFHPNDWQDIVTLQDANGRYILGDPASTAVRTLWGVPAVVTSAATENTALVGDFATYAYIARRQETRVEMGWISNNFIDRVRTIRAYKRVGLVIRRQTAFCKLTGI